MSRTQHSMRGLDGNKNLIITCGAIHEQVDESGRYIEEMRQIVRAGAIIITSLIVFNIILTATLIGVVMI